jgi:hypothetical protein
MPAPTLPPLQRQPMRPQAPQQPIAQQPVQQRVQERPPASLQARYEDRSAHATSFATNRFLYWSGLLFLTVMNFVIAFILLPLTLLLHGWTPYVLVIVFGLLFGVIFDFLIKDLEHLEKRHHLFAAIVIPVISIVDLFLIQSIAKSISVVLNIKLAQNPMIAGSLYLLAFLGPFTYSYLIKKEID